MEPTITPEDVATLNAARTVLDRIARDFYYEAGTQASGVIFASADDASDAIFSLLNRANSHGGFSLTDDELHNKVVG